MIFPESELSTYLGFFVPAGQVDPLLDRIAEASSEAGEMDLVSFLHLAHRELELTGDMNRDDAAVVLIEEMQLPLADAAAVLEEAPTVTAARIQSAWDGIPTTSPEPALPVLSDGPIRLDQDLVLDEALILDPALGDPGHEPDSGDELCGAPPGEPQLGATQFGDTWPGDIQPEETQPGDSLPGHTQLEGPPGEELGHVLVDGPETVGQPPIVDPPQPPVEPVLAAEPQLAPDPDVPVTPAPLVFWDEEYDAPTEVPESQVDAEPDDAHYAPWPADIIEGLAAEGIAPEAYPDPAVPTQSPGTESPGADLSDTELPATQSIDAELPDTELTSAESGVDNSLDAGESADGRAHVVQVEQGLPQEEPDIAPSPYDALTPDALEGSSLSFPWNPEAHNQPVTAASLLALEDDPELHGFSEPITHVTGHIPVAEILDGELDEYAAFPSQPQGVGLFNTGAPSHPNDQVPVADDERVSEELASALMAAAARGDALIYDREHATDGREGAAPGLPTAGDDSLRLSDAAPDTHNAGVFDEDHTMGVDVATDIAVAAMPDVALMDAFGDVGMPDQLAPASQNDAPLAASAHHDAGLGAANADGVPNADGVANQVAGLSPHGADATHDHPPAPATGVHGTWTGSTGWVAKPSPTQVITPAPWPMPPLLMPTQAGDRQVPYHQGNQSHHDAGSGADPDDTQQFPMVDLLEDRGLRAGRGLHTDHPVTAVPAPHADRAQEHQPEPQVGAHFTGQPGISPSVDRFIHELHAAWIAGGDGALEAPDHRSDSDSSGQSPLGGRFELAEAPPPEMGRAARKAARSSGDSLTNDDAVEATYEEEPREAEPPPPPVPTAVWIPGMAERAFRATPWHQLDNEDDDRTPENMHGFGLSGYRTARPEAATTPASKMQIGDVAAFMAEGPASAPDWDEIEEGTWAHADYGPKRPKANRVGQGIGLIATMMAAGVVYLALTWEPLARTIGSLGLPVHHLVVIGAVAGVLGVGGISMFIGSSLPKKPKTKVVRKRRRKHTASETATVADPTAYAEEVLGEAGYHPRSGDDEPLADDAEVYVENRPEDEIEAGMPDDHQ